MCKRKLKYYICVLFRLLSLLQHILLINLKISFYLFKTFNYSKFEQTFDKKIFWVPFSAVFGQMRSSLWDILSKVISS